MVAPNDGLMLGWGAVQSYGRLDQNNDGYLTPSEVGNISDEELGKLLSSALGGDSDNFGANNHHAFFNALPASRVASLFINNLFDLHYLKAWDPDSKIKFNGRAVLEEILKAGSPEEYLQADRFMISARITMDQWPELIAKMESPALSRYWESRTTLQYQDLPNAEQMQKLDIDGNGKIDRNELKKIGNVELGAERSFTKFNGSVSGLVPAVLGAAMDPQRQVAISYITAGLEGQLLATFDTCIFNYCKQNDLRPPQPSLTNFFSTRILLDPAGTQKAVGEVATASGIIYAFSYREILDYYINEEAKELLAMIPIVISIGPLFGDGLTEPIEERPEPYKIDGIEAVTEENFQSSISNSVVNPVLVVFADPRCSACEIAKEVISDIHKEYGSALKIITVDVVANPNLGEQYVKREFPAFILFRGDSKLMQQEGLDSRTGDELKNEIHRVHPKPKPI